MTRKIAFGVGFEIECEVKVSHEETLSDGRTVRVIDDAEILEISLVTPGCENA